MSIPIHSQTDAGQLARSDLLTQRTALAVDKLAALMPVQDTAETSSRDTSTNLGSTGRVPGARPGDASAGNGATATPGSTRETLSSAARTILDLFANADGEAAPLASASPLATRTEMQSAPLLATKLATLLDQSGMFYEAHLAEWVSGARTLKDIAREPQAQLARPTPGNPGATLPTAADEPLHQLLALPYSPRDAADTAHTALLAAARTGLSDAPDADAALTGRAGNPTQGAAQTGGGTGPMANRQADASSFGRHPPATRTITVGDPIPGPDGARTQSLHAAQSYADVAHAGDPPRAPLLPSHASPPDTAAAPQPQGPVVHPATEGLMRQQLELLAAQQFRWQGEAWAGTQMSWEVSPERADEDGSGAQARARNWTTRIVVQMPGIGVVEANLTLSPTTLDVRVNAPLDDTVSRLNAAIPDLHGRLAASGFVVGQITARADTAPLEAGASS
ncbi:flagellar hook-length control protein FliK [Cupriavidus sp. BIS7]|uniref:flagellar hook-length control protein FliK n=1 Tax=Cupriavidus sp. BIS7 TaxID=1217718 RepID=UPI0002F7F6D6|nr:flagellar hook-length control protein FliK [Cupriavidus sp. BIS7]